MRRLLMFVMIFGLLLLAAPALAQQTITIEVVGVAQGAEGDVVQVAEASVDAAVVGSACTGVLETENNGSVHPGNALIIATGDTVVEIPGVEEDPGQTFSLDGTVVVGDTVTVSIRFGPQGVTSGGMVLTLECAQQETTTTTAPPDETTTTAAPTDTTTTAAPTDTTAAPAETTTTATPSGGVSTGGGGTAGSDAAALRFVGIGAALAAGAGFALAWRRRSTS